jgi:hypoxanthine phosphoribosyltransferase
METVPYNLDKCIVDVHRIATQIYETNWMPKHIYGASRGGLIPAVMLAHVLGIKSVHSLNVSSIDDIAAGMFKMPKNCNILIIDDICDSGLTIRDITQLASKQDYLLAKTACLLYNTAQNEQIDYAGTKFSRLEQPLWYDFFWEVPSDELHISSDCLY